MQIIYIHGLNSDHQAIKGNLLKTFCQEHYPNIKVQTPNLNHPPEQVIDMLNDMISQDSVLIGSSLGGYFSTLLANQTGCASVLLNPSIQPHISLQRFFTATPPEVWQNLGQISADDPILQQIGHTTPQGWQIRIQDLQWFAKHPLKDLAHPNKIWVILKTGDELLDYRLAMQFYQSHQAEVLVQQGGDHRMSDFDRNLPLILQGLAKLM